MRAVRWLARQVALAVVIAVAAVVLFEAGTFLLRGHW